MNLESQRIAFEKELEMDPQLQKDFELAERESQLAKVDEDEVQTENKGSKKNED